MLLDHDEPTNYEEAMVSPDSANMAWSHEIWDEIHIWEQSMDFDWLANDRRAIEIKWIFKRKTDADSSVTIYKARLVAKGFWQVQGVNYNEIFSTIAMLKSVWIMLAIAAFYEIWQMDKQNRIP